MHSPLKKIAHTEDCIITSFVLVNREISSHRARCLHIYIPISLYLFCFLLSGSFNKFREEALRPR